VLIDRESRVGKVTQFVVVFLALLRLGVSVTSDYWYGVRRRGYSGIISVYVKTLFYLNEKTVCFDDEYAPCPNSAVLSTRDTRVDSSSFIFELEYSKIKKK